MHPDDVRDFVTEQVAELRGQIDRQPKLGVSSVTLEPDLTLQIAIRQRALKSATVTREIAGRGLLLPGAGGQAIQAAYNVPLLGESVERELILAMNCVDFDSQPPTAELLTVAGQPLPPKEWPHDETGAGIILAGYSRYRRPFFCRRGLREYHEHPQHQDDPWDLHREGFTLASIAVGLLSDLANRWGMTHI